MLPKTFNRDYLNNLLGTNSPIIKIKKLMLKRSYTDKWHHQDQNYVFWLTMHDFYVLG